MSDNSTIEWTDTTWNPTTGCDRISAGCDNCYALTLAERLKGMGSAKYQTDGDPRTSGPGFGVAVHDDALTIPLKWRKPRKVFVNSMSDLFHENVPDDYIAKVFAVMSQAPQHAFQLLTKRHGRMKSLLNRKKFTESVQRAVDALYDDPDDQHVGDGWPLRNVWLGISVENQQWADIRVPALLKTPAAVRFLSCEPLLGPVDLVQSVNKLDWLDPASLQPGGIDWVIAGGESGPGARPMHPDWARTLRDQCQAAGVPYFFKQHGEWVEARRDRATHLLHVNGSLVDRANATTDNPYGEGSGLDQDLVDRGHPGWVRVRRVGKKAAGRELDGRTHDEYPVVAR